MCMRSYWRLYGLSEEPSKSYFMLRFDNLSSDIIAFCHWVGFTDVIKVMIIWTGYGSYLGLRLRLLRASVDEDPPYDGKCLRPLSEARREKEGLRPQLLRRAHQF